MKPRQRTACHTPAILNNAGDKIFFSTGQTTPLPCPGMQLFGQVSLVTGYTDSLQAGLSQKGAIVEGSGVSYGEACG